MLFLTRVPLAMPRFRSVATLFRSGWVLPVRLVAVPRVAGGVGWAGKGAGGGAPVVLSGAVLLVLPSAPPQGGSTGRRDNAYAQLGKVALRVILAPWLTYRSKRWFLTSAVS